MILSLSMRFRSEHVQTPAQTKITTIEAMYTCKEMIWKGDGWHDGDSGEQHPHAPTKYGCGVYTKWQNHCFVVMVLKSFVHPLMPLSLERGR